MKSDASNSSYFYSLPRLIEPIRILEGLNKSKYSFIKNEDSLNERQKEELKAAQEVSPILAKMHRLKEEFRDIFELTKFWGSSVIDLLDWMHKALSYFPKSIGTMVRWFGEIVGYFDGKTTSGTVEGINNKLKFKHFFQLFCDVWAKLITFGVNICPVVTHDSQCFYHLHIAVAIAKPFN
jgi:hypothetical protein